MRYLSIFLALLLSIVFAYDSNVDRYKVSVVKLNEIPQAVDQTIVGDGDVTFRITESDGDPYVSPYSGELYATRYVDNYPGLWVGDTATLELNIPLEVGYYELVLESRGIADYDTNTVELDTLYGHSVNAWFIKAEVASSLGDGRIVRSEERTKLEGTYPNPFNPVSVVGFYVDRPTNVKLIVRDIRGRQVKVITDQKYSVGYHTASYDMTGASSGTYIITMIADGYMNNIKAFFLK